VKINALLASFLISGSVFAQNTALLPISTLIPAVPQGTNTATLPAPRQDWVQRVSDTNKKAQEHASDIELIFDGDSITDYWTFNGKQTWTDHFAKPNTFNFAISGDRTQNILWRLSQGQVDGMHPKLIAVMIGTNNIDANTPEEIADGITAIVAEYQKRCPGAVILLEALLPRDENPSNPYRAKIKTINGIISKLGDGQKVIYVDFGDKFLKPDGTINRDLMPDALHPSAKGYEIWTDVILPIVNKYIPAK